jgi:hypothetical protein
MLSYIIKLGLIISSSLMGVTGILKFPGLLVQWGLYYELSGILTIIHDWSGVVMGLIALLHVIFNWRRLYGYTRRTSKVKNGKVKLIILGVFSLLLTSAIPFGLTLANYNYSNETGVFLIENTGIYHFNIADVQTLRPDIFKPRSFSLFDILAHLDKEGQLDAEYYFNSSMKTYVIESINGKKNWWYSAYYHEGWHEENVFRLDHYLYKPNMRIFLYQENPSRIANIYRSFKREIDRLNANNGTLIVPTIRLNLKTQSFNVHNFTITAHNLRNDVFQEGVITGIDVIMSLGDQDIITYKLTWYELIDTAIVGNYFVENINSEIGHHSRCGYLYEAGENEFRGDKGNDIHISSDIRVLDSPDYVRWFYACV